MASTIVELLDLTQWQTDGLKIAGRPERRYRYYNFAGAMGIQQNEDAYHAHTYHPYDLAEYHRAVSRDGEHWSVYLDRTSAGEVTTGDAATLLHHLRGLDRDRGIKAQIDRS